MLSKKLEQNSPTPFLRVLPHLRHGAVQLRKSPWIIVRSLPKLETFGEPGLHLERGISSLKHPRSPVARYVSEGENYENKEGLMHVLRPESRARFNSENNISIFGKLLPPHKPV